MEVSGFSAAQIRLARPTDKFDEVVNFYERGLGLERLTDFTGNRGYVGIILGVPGCQYQLAFTHHQDGSLCPARTTDNLLVIYRTKKKEIDKIIERLSKMGYEEVEPENGYWKERGKTIEDPDGWRVVLMNTKGI